MNPYLPEGFLALGLVGAISLILLIRLAPLARKIGLVDRPSERKLHDDDVPAIGGIAIYLSFLLALTLAPFGLQDHRILILSTGLLMILGVLDDHNDVRPSTKFIVQVLIALSLVYIGDAIVPSIGDIFAWHDGNEQGLGPLALVLTVIGVVAVINAFNMIDGHDGVASGMFLITAVVLIGFCGMGANWKWQFLLTLISIPVGIFFLFNTGILPQKTNKVFLGDAGSMLLGLMLAYFVISLTNQEESVLRRVQVPWILGLPVLDMIAVLVDRIKSRRSPVVADRLHLHHLLLRSGLRPYLVLVTMLLIHLALNLVAVLGGWLSIPDWILFWGLLLVVIGYMLARRRLVSSIGRS